MSSNDRRIKSLETTYKILEVLKKNGHTTLSAINDQLDVTKATVHTHLMTLNTVGFVQKQDGGYQLGPKLMTYGAHVKNRHLIYQAGKVPAMELAFQTGEIVEIATEHNGRCVILHRFYGENTVDTDYQQQSLEEFRHLHYGATGKAMLAQMEAERIDRMIEQYGLPQRTENTITDRESLLEELEATRERGYALNDGEEVRGIRAVGTHVLNSNQRLLGAICLAGPRGRVDDTQFTEEFPRLINETQSIIEINVETNEFDVFQS